MRPCLLFGYWHSQREDRVHVVLVCANTVWVSAVLLKDKELSAINEFAFHKAICFRCDENFYNVLLEISSSQ